MSNKWGLKSYFIHNREYFFKELEQIKKLGFDGAAVIDPQKFTLTLPQIKKGFKKSGLSLLQMYAGYYNLANLEARKCQKAIEWYKKRIEYALELEAEELVICSGEQGILYGTSEERGRVIRDNVSFLREIVKEARETNLKISITNIPGRVEFSPHKLSEIVNIVREESNYKNIGVCLNLRVDISDPFGRERGVEETIFQIRDCLNSVYLQEKHPLLAGRGPSKWDRVMKVFKKINYLGPFILEVERWSEQVEALMGNIRYFERLMLFKKRLTEAK